MATAKAKEKTEKEVVQKAPTQGSNTATDTHLVRTLMPVQHNGEWIAEDEVVEMSVADYTHLMCCGAVVLETA